jgi:sigma-E factor negative regulatory protein RseA
MDTNKKLREQISSLKDGALPEPDLELAFAAMQGSDGKQTWELYHLIGDTLRDTPAPALSPGFAARLAERLADEPLPLRRSPVAAEPSGLAAVLAKSASS